MPELSVKAGTLAWTDIPAFKNMVIKQVMAKLSDKLLTHFFRHSRIFRQILQLRYIDYHRCELPIVLSQWASCFIDLVTYYLHRR